MSTFIAIYHTCFIVTTWLEVLGLKSIQLHWLLWESAYIVLSLKNFFIVSEMLKSLDLHTNKRLKLSATTHSVIIFIFSMINSSFPQFRSESLHFDFVHICIQFKHSTPLHN